MAVFRLLVAAFLVLAAWSVQAQTYAVPDGAGGYNYVDATTPQTITIGPVSLPPPWLLIATPKQRQELGILPVVSTPQPDTATNVVTGQSIQVINGTPTVVWTSRPVGPQQQAQTAYDAAVAAGIVISCAQVSPVCTPAVTGTYAVDAASWISIVGIVAGLNSSRGVPGGGGTFMFYDRAGVGHPFTGPQFLNFAQAVRDYAYALTQARVQTALGGAPVWPSNQVSIP